MAQGLRCREINGRNKDISSTIQYHQRNMVRDFTSVSPISFQLPSAYFENHETKVTTLAFDTEGLLVAAGNSSGTIAVYDFTDYFYACNLTQKEQTEAPITMPVIREIKQPVNLGSIQCIKWNPKNQNEIAVSFSNSPSVHIYNLASYNPSTPRVSFVAGARPSSAVLDILFVSLVLPSESRRPLKKRKTHVKSEILTCDSDGYLRMTTGNKSTSWLFRLSKAKLQCLHLSTPSVALCGTSAGEIIAVDFINLKNERAAFQKCKASPQVRYKICIKTLLLKVGDTHNIVSPRDVGVVSIKPHPHSTIHIAVELQNKWLCIIDTISHRVVRLHKARKELITTTRDSVILQETEVTSNIEAALALHHQEIHHRFENSNLCVSGNFFLSNFFISCNKSELCIVDLRQGRAVLEEDNKRRPGRVQCITNLDYITVPLNHTSSSITAIGTHLAHDFIVIGTSANALTVIGTNSFETFRESKRETSLTESCD